MTSVTYLRARMVACLMSGIALNVGHIMLKEWRYFKIQDGTLLSFLSLITKLCRRVDMEEYPIGTWVKPRPYITLLKIRGEGTPRHNKKRKIDLVKSTVEEPKSCRPPTARPLEDIGIDVRAIKDLVSGFPQGIEELSSRHYSYVSHEDYEKYKD
ncbi:hypothetical protein FXO37_23556 [Capsicum annuum]|nr:hypothetical protein FXO37_23556 [Capsicum annuum]